MPGFGAIGELAINDVPRIARPARGVATQPIDSLPAGAIDNPPAVGPTRIRPRVVPLGRILQPTSLFAWTDLDALEDF